MSLWDRERESNRKIHKNRNIEREKDREKGTGR